MNRLIPPAIVALAASLSLLAALSAPALAKKPAKITSAKITKGSHGLSAFGDLKYKANFTHFDYVNPNAPKGGRLAMIGTAGRITFNTFNQFIIKGDAAQGLDFLYDSLMVRAADEPDAMYGLVAKSAVLAPDKLSVVFHMRPAARFYDGSKLTADDVVYSFEILKSKGHPRYRFPLRDVTKAEALDANTVKFSFTGEAVRDLPLIVAGLPILSKAFYAKNKFDKTTLTPPLTSGPYKIDRFRQGRTMTFKRRTDYWAQDLPVNKGRFNFDELRYEYFRDRAAEFEGLKSGAFDLREEFTSRDWAKKYDITQVKSGRLQRLVLPDERPSGAQGFFINLRRDKFKDPMVRKALDLAFDYEWTNKNLFYSSYIRTSSYFENSPMKAEGLPSPAELAILKPFADKLPKAVFDLPYVAPKSNGSGQDRGNLRKASRLLKQAGWAVKNTRRVNAKGEQFKIEFLVYAPTSERLIVPYLKNLKLLGIDATVRRVDPAQYEERSKKFDFDIVIQRFVLKTTPGVELRAYWSSKAADSHGAFNLSGIKNPVIDALIEKLVASKTRTELTTTARALDRVLRAGHYWVPHWYKASHWVAIWNKFQKPASKPKFARGIIDTWWFAPAKAAKLK